MAEQFTSRWGIILASLGMAIGAGNIWRFPRLAGQYGGTFIILWFLFLFIWSIPILLTEFAIGKKYKAGVIKSFKQHTKGKYTWMGIFVSLCTLGIAFYYSVVVSWTLQYLGLGVQLVKEEFILGKVGNTIVSTDPTYLTNFWHSISSENIYTFIFHVIAIFLGLYALSKGISKGLERTNKYLIPLLFLLLIGISLFALFAGDGYKGLIYMYSIDFSKFGDTKIWIEAISQSAWSTGAGWGLMLTISSYSKSDENVVFNVFASGIGNNIASLVAGMAILPAVFAFSQSEQMAQDSLIAGNQALTFTIIPQMFSSIPRGSLLTLVFFFAFFAAAMSSLLSMLEMLIRLVGDFGISRMKAIVFSGVIAIIAGFPSSWRLDFFNNQDWVWGLGLILNGCFVIILAFHTGVIKFKHLYIDKDSKQTVPDLYYLATLPINLLLAFVLIVWWMSQGFSENPWFTPDGYWNVFDVYSNASIVTQWGIVFLIAFLIQNKKLFISKK